MPLIRGHHSFDDHFTQIPNTWLRDKSISLGAKGLLAQLMSHSPGWQISQQSLGEANGVGKDAIRTIINELLNAGYLIRSDARERNEKGYLGGFSYITSEPSMAGEPTLDEPTLDNPPHKKNILKEEQFIKNNERNIHHAFSKFWEVYPKKTDKGQAIKAFKKALGKVDEELIIAGARDYAEDPNLPDKLYIKNPATWLNAEAWDNGPLPTRKRTLSRDEENKNAMREFLKNAEN